jgi:hypothetical protein
MAWHSLSVRGSGIPSRRFGCLSFVERGKLFILGGMKLEKYVSAGIYTLDTD